VSHDLGSQFNGNEPLPLTPQATVPRETRIRRSTFTPPHHAALPRRNAVYFYSGAYKIAYSRKTEVLALSTEHARLTTALEQTEEQLRAGTQELGRIDNELALHPEPPDPTVLIATIERAKSLGDTDNAIARLNSDIKRLTNEANRELSTLGLWSGNLERLETLRVPLAATIDQYARDWESNDNVRRELGGRLSHTQDTILKTQAELERVALKVGKVGEGDLAEVRARHCFRPPLPP
jgi:chromosome segregation ATPase